MQWWLLAHEHHTRRRRARRCEERPWLPCGRRQWLAATPLQAAAALISPAGGASGNTCEGRAESPGGLWGKKCKKQPCRPQGRRGCRGLPQGLMEEDHGKAREEGKEMGSQVTPLQIDHRPLFPVPLWLLGWGARGWRSWEWRSEEPSSQPRPTGHSPASNIASNQEEPEIHRKQKASI